MGESGAGRLQHHPRDHGRDGASGRRWRHGCAGLAAGAEAHLLHAGAALDCIGARLKEIPSPLVTAVLARHPRQGFKQRMAAALDDQATVRYASRAAFLARLGFNRLIQAAPFAE